MYLFPCIRRISKNVIVVIGLHSRILQDDPLDSASSETHESGLTGLVGSGGLQLSLTVCPVPPL